MNKLRIAYITSEEKNNIKHWSGSSYNIYKCLKKTKNEITWYSTSNPLIYKLLFFWEIFLRFFGINYDRSRSKSVSKFYSKKIKKFIANSNFDCIFVHQCSLVSFLNTNIPIYIWTDLTYDLYQKDYLKYKNSISIKNGNLLDSLALKKAKKIFYTSVYAKKNAVKKYNIENTKIEVIPFGSNFEYNFNKKSIYKLINARKISKKKNIRFLSIGVDWYRKGMDDTIKVIDLLNKKGFKCSLSIVGCYPPKNIKILNFIKLHGYLNKELNSDRNKLKKLFKDSHFFILMSKAEALGVVFNEASSFGLPSIAPNIGGISSTIDNDGGILVKKNERAQTIANKISKLLNNKNLYKKKSILSFSRYQNKNNWNIIASKLIKKL